MVSTDEVPETGFGLHVVALGAIPAGGHPAAAPAHG